MFLSRVGFPERGTGGPVAVLVGVLTFSMSLGISRYFRGVGIAPPAPFYTVLSFIAFGSTTPKELPSFHGRGQAPSPFHRVSFAFRL